jgi:hypothetical protein
MTSLIWLAVIRTPLLFRNGIVADAVGCCSNPAILLMLAMLLLLRSLASVASASAAR